MTSPRTVLRAVVPLVLLAALVAIIIRTGPAETVRGENVPPVEVLAFGRIVLTSSGFTVNVLNDGPDPVTIAQVAVDDAFWAFEATPGATLDHLERAQLTIPYPWVHGEAHVVKILTATGLTFEQDIPVAIASPSATPRVAWIFVLIGLYVGVIPVAIGLLWYPLMSSLGKRGMDFVLALTIGLLLFLLVDSIHEGAESALGLPASYQGVALLLLGAAGAYLTLDALGAWLQERRRDRAAAGQRGWVLALLMAIGIGLHNFSEGLAIGAAFALGEAALGTLLIVGFMLHNATEGLAIVAPLGRERVRVSQLIWLGIVGGAPTIAGAVLGGLFYSPVLSVLFLAMGAGAIAQVTAQIAKQVAGERPIAQFLATAPALAGLFAGFSVMYATGMIVG